MSRQRQVDEADFCDRRLLPRRPARDGRSRTVGDEDRDTHARYRSIRACGRARKLLCVPEQLSACWDGAHAGSRRSSSSSPPPCALATRSPVLPRPPVVVLDDPSRPCDDLLPARPSQPDRRRSLLSWRSAVRLLFALLLSSSSRILHPSDEPRRSTKDGQSAQAWREEDVRRRRASVCVCGRASCLPRVGRTSGFARSSRLTLFFAVRLSFSSSPDLLSLCDSTPLSGALLSCLCRLGAPLLPHPFSSGLRRPRYLRPPSPPRALLSLSSLPPSRSCLRLLSSSSAHCLLTSAVSTEQLASEVCHRSLRSFR